MRVMGVEFAASNLSPVAIELTDKNELVGIEGCLRFIRNT